MGYTANIWKFFQNFNQLQKIEYDTSFNGKIDRWEYYDSSGDLALVELDRNHDGNIDIIKKSDNKFTESKPSPAIDNFNIDQVNNWIKAWKSKNFKLYFSFYSNNFRGTKESRQSWEESKEHTLKKYLTIDIEAKSIQIARSGNKIKVSFIQFFKSDKFSDVGNKLLYWENRETGWKIVKEVWSPI